MDDTKAPPPADKPEAAPDLTHCWTVQLRIPVPDKVARELSDKDLQLWLAKALVGAIQGVPPDFIVASAEKVKADLKPAEAPVLILPGDKPFKM